MIDYVSAVRSESARFRELISASSMDGDVPSCPEWSVADLAWHLAEVQYFWATIVDELLEDPASMADLERPSDDRLPGLFAEQSARLVAALERRRPDDRCWSWHTGGQTVGWVRRRQAHEVLIHRVDAALAAGAAIEIDPELAADGVDEVLRVMIDATDLPEWATFGPDGPTAIIEVDGATSWALELGRFTGTSPTSGTVFDDAAARLTDLAGSPSAVIRGTAADVDLWLWGRGPLDRLTVEGDAEVAQVIRAAAIDATQ